MSWVGVASGAPWAGDRMLLEESMRMRASACASADSGRWTAIWSPSKSALKAWQTSGWTWIALPSTSTGSNGRMAKRWSVGGRFSSTGWRGVSPPEHRLERLDAQAVERRSPVQQHRMLVDDLLEHVPHLGDHRVDHLLGRLDVLRGLTLDQAGHDERLEQLERHQLRQPALVQAQRWTGD